MDNQTKKPHVHAECIKAWADGIKVQFKSKGDIVWHDLDNSGWCTWDVNNQYRIKPEPKPDVVRFTNLPNPTWEGEYEKTNGNYSSYKQNHHNLKLIFDGETGKLKKAEVIG